MRSSIRTQVAYGLSLMVAAIALLGLVIALNL